MPNLIYLTVGWVTALSADPTSPPLPHGALGHHLGPPSAPAATSDVGGLDDFTWAQVVPLAAALINAARARRESLTTLYGDALGAVAEYLEGPYRILRKDGEASTRFAITSKLSDVKTSIDHHQALLRLHADPAVADAYDLFVNAAKAEVGQQMHDAWEASPVTTDAGVNLNVALPREASNKKRDLAVEMMQAHLRRRWYSSVTRERYKKAAGDVAEAIEQAKLEREAKSAPGGGPKPAS